MMSRSGQRKQMAGGGRKYVAGSPKGAMSGHKTAAQVLGTSRDDHSMDENSPNHGRHNHPVPKLRGGY
jgi:hypothetical protein